MLVTLLALATIAGGAFLWHTRERKDWFYTDAETIRQRAARAPVRDVLWQPAARLPGVSTDGEEYEPRISEDGQTMFFVRGKAGGGADIWWATREREAWTRPQPLAAANSPSDDLGPDPSADGTALYFYSDRAGGLGGYDLWVSRRAPDGWEPPTNLGPAVNSTFNDYGPALTHDGGTLYFSSNRPRPGDPAPTMDRWPATIRELHEFRDYDLYTAAVTERGLAQAARLDALSTESNEGTPSLSPFGDFLYFSSDRPGGLGGFDLYRSRRLPDRLEAPESLGVAINSPANELDPALSMGGFALTFSSNRPDEAATPEAGEEAARDYDLYRSYSREVFRDFEPTRATIDWAAILPWLWWLLWPAILALLAWLLWRARGSDRFRQLSLLAKCLLLSALIHALILLGTAFWYVGNSLDGWFRDAGGGGLRITTNSPAGGDGIASQVLGGITDVAVEPMAMIQTTRLETVPDEAPAAPDPVAFEVGRNRTTISVPREAASAADAPSPEAPALVTTSTEPAAQTPTEVAIPAPAAPAAHRETELAVAREALPAPDGSHPRSTGMQDAATTLTAALAPSPASVPAPARDRSIAEGPSSRDSAAPAATAPPTSAAASSDEPAFGVEVRLATPAGGARQSASEASRGVSTARAPETARASLQGESASSALAAIAVAPARVEPGSSPGAGELSPAREAAPGVTAPALAAGQDPAGPSAGLSELSADVRIPAAARAGSGTATEPTVGAPLAAARGTRARGRDEPRAGEPRTFAIGAPRTAGVAGPSTSFAPTASAAEAPGPAPAAALPRTPAAGMPGDEPLPDVAFGLPHNEPRSVSGGRAADAGAPAQAVLATPAARRPSLSDNAIPAAAAALGAGPAAPRSTAAPRQLSAGRGAALATDAAAPAWSAQATALAEPLAALDPPVDGLGLRLPSETEATTAAPGGERGAPDPDRSLSGFVFDASTGEPIEGARVRLDLPGGDSMVVRTGPDGAYALHPPSLPEHIAVTATRRGYTPGSIGLPAAELSGGLRHDFRLVPAERTTIALETDPQVHHLGDGEFEGQINSQFQKPCEGRVYEAAFRLTEPQAAAAGGRGEAEVLLLAKGLQGVNEIRINGNLLDDRFTGSPADGSFGAFRARFPAEWLRAGDNTLGITSVRGAHDFDDFEFVNPRIRVNVPPGRGGAPPL